MIGASVGSSRLLETRHRYPPRLMPQTAFSASHGTHARAWAAHNADIGSCSRVPLPAITTGNAEAINMQ
eukprot:6176667-Pleurochrysis_carterae.AAC.2